MYLHGEFANINGHTVSVHFLKGDRTEEIIIGRDGIMFGAEPVTIQTEIEDTFTPIIKKTCTVTLLTNRYIGDLLFANNSRDIKVNVFKDGSFVFGGFVEPCAFTQPFCNEWEEVQITCLDTLSTLQYLTPLTDGSSYESLMEGATVKSFADFIMEMGLNDEINFVDHSQPALFYDGSIQLNGGSNILAEIGISESLFLGEEESDVMTYEEILTELLQYLNLHIMQTGQYYYIFNWESLKTKNQVQFTDIYGNASFPQVISRYDIVPEDYGSNDTSFSIDEVYNQIAVTCDITPIETVIENPLEEESLKPLFNKRSKFLTEYCSKGKNADDLYRLKAIITGSYGSDDYSNTWWRDWYVQTFENPKWRLNNPLYQDAEANRHSFLNSYGQWEMLKYSKQINFLPMFAAFGNTGKQKLSDDSPQPELNMTPALYISVNGTTDNSENNLNFISGQLQNHTPLATYNSGKSVMLSPADADTTNYLVFSGNMVLLPIMEKSGMRKQDTYDKSQNTIVDFLNQQYYAVGISTFETCTVPIEDKAFYQQQFLEDGNFNSDNYEEFSYPYISEYNGEQLQYNYSTNPINNGFDNVKKVPILECQLKVGNKYCVESFDNDGNSVFEWLTLEQCPTYNDNGVTKKHTTFSLGFNPAVGDKIIGKKYSLATNFDFQTGIEANSGTAIPISKNDNLIGDLEFQIMGVINATWQDVVRRHSTWFRSASYSTNTQSILANIHAIQIDEFECKLYTDNARLDNSGDNDLIYYSSEQQTYINKKDDITFKLNTALTSQEASELGVKNTVNLSSVVRMNDGTYIDKVTDNNLNKSAKPEELFVETYYNEYSTPKMIIDTTLRAGYFSSPFYRCRFKYLNDKWFYPICQQLDLMNDKVTTKLKEV